MLSSVLATDMSHHFKELGSFKSSLMQKDFNPTEGEDKEKAMCLLFHFADISNPAKNWNLCVKWTDLLFIEFFGQGDLEKQHNLPVS